jgi:hypothetical protein
MVEQYRQLNPLAMAVAAGCTALLVALFVGFPMAGMMGYGSMWGGGFSMGHGIAWWLGGALVAALAGAVFAWIYNAVVGSQQANTTASGPGSESRLPSRH